MKNSDNHNQKTAGSQTQKNSNSGQIIDFKSNEFSHTQKERKIAKIKKAFEAAFPINQESRQAKRRKTRKKNKKDKK